MKFDDCIYKEITWFNADEIVEHETFDGIDSYGLLRNLATLEAGYSLDDWSAYVLAAYDQLTTAAYLLHQIIPWTKEEKQ